MIEKHSFRAIIENAGGGGAFIRVPFDVEQAFGKKRVLVRSTINGQPYLGTLVRMGESCHILVVLKGIRRNRIAKSIEMLKKSHVAGLQGDAKNRE